MDESRRVDQLDRRGGSAESRLLAACEAGDEHEQRAQALAAGVDRMQRVRLDDGDLAQTGLDTRHSRAQRFATELEDRVKRFRERLAHTCPPPAGGCVGPGATTPTCRAMIPPAVRM